MEFRFKEPFDAWLLRLRLALALTHFTPASVLTAADWRKIDAEVKR